MAHCATVKTISIGRRVYVKKAVKTAAVPGLSAEPFETRFISPETIVPASRFTDSHRLCWSESAMMLARAHWKGLIRHCGKPAPGFFKRNRTAGRRPFAPAPGHGAGLTVHDHHLQRHAQRRRQAVENHAALSPTRTTSQCRSTSFESAHSMGLLPQARMSRWHFLCSCEELKSPRRVVLTRRQLSDKNGIQSVQPPTRQGSAQRRRGPWTIAQKGLGKAELEGRPTMSMRT